MRSEEDEERHEVAFAMLTQLPKFGVWAEAIREFATPYGTLGYRQASVLWAIRHGLLLPEELTPTGFATYFRIQPSVVTRALAKLEQSGFIVRSVDAHDTRVSHIATTEAGAAISRYIEQLYIDDLLSTLDDLSDDQLAELKRSLALLDRIADQLDRQRLSRTRRAATSQPR